MLPSAVHTRVACPRAPIGCTQSTQSRAMIAWLPANPLPRPQPAAGAAAPAAKAAAAASSSGRRGLRSRSAANMGDRWARRRRRCLSCAAQPLSSSLPTSCSPALRRPPPSAPQPGHHGCRGAGHCLCRRGCHRGRHPAAGHARLHTARRLCWPCLRAVADDHCGLWLAAERDERARHVPRPAMCVGVGGGARTRVASRAGSGAALLMPATRPPPPPPLGCSIPPRTPARLAPRVCTPGARAGWLLLPPAGRALGPKRPPARLQHHRRRRAPPRPRSRSRHPLPGLAPPKHQCSARSSLRAASRALRRARCPASQSRSTPALKSWSACLRCRRGLPALPLSSSGSTSSGECLRGCAHARVVWVPAAAPCTSGSRAREGSLPRWLASRVPQQPSPLPAPTPQVCVRGAAAAGRQPLGPQSRGLRAMERRGVPAAALPAARVGAALRHARRGQHLAVRPASRGTVLHPVACGLWQQGTVPGSSRAPSPAAALPAAPP